MAVYPLINDKKIDILLKAQFEELEISEISIRRFLTQKEDNNKDPLQIVRMKLSKKQQDCNYKNLIKIGIETMYS